MGERGFDMFRFLVDGAEQSGNGFPQSGSQSQWRLARFRIPKGLHSITWRYDKDARGRSGDDFAQVAEIEIRNMKVAPVTITETLQITHVDGNLAAQEGTTAAVLANILGLPGPSVTARYVETRRPAGPNQRLLAAYSSARSPTPDPVRTASLYNFYSLRIQASCPSSSICRNISST